MTQDIIVMAREAGIADAFLVTPHPGVVQQLERFAALVRAAERNKLAAWMMAQDYATGHGDTMEGLLEELEREVGFKRAELWIKRINEAVAEEREACAKVCDHMAARCNDIRAAALESAAENIRARGNT
jgi:uncharacterized coiled-coil protein SlyX